MANNPGVNKLALILADRMRLQAVSPPAVEFGTVTQNFSLVTDTFRIPIPRQDYKVDKRLLGEENKLQENDRVLVTWVNDTPVILCVVASGGK